MTAQPPHTPAADDERLCAMAMSRMRGLSLPTALHLCRELGSAYEVYAHRADITHMVPDCMPQVAEAVADWSEGLRIAEEELRFVSDHNIQVLPFGSADYPQRLRECADAPLVLYYLGTADLNQARVVSIVGTRHITAYGQDLVRRFTQRLRELCPDVLIVSGLAYGVDINAHRQALQYGFDTVGVLAHGLDHIYPYHHIDTAKQMTRQGGLLSEYMSGTVIDKGNFVRRNRIVAGMADATILVESAAKGGGLITCSIAQDYNRQVFAFPGAVGATYSEGCNNLIRDNGAALISGADDFVQAMGWPTTQQRKAKGVVERQMFPELSADEQLVVSELTRANDQQLNLLSVKTNMPIGQLSALLFQMEMKGVVKLMAGGVYHLIIN